MMLHLRKTRSMRTERVWRMMTPRLTTLLGARLGTCDGVDSSNYLHLFHSWPQFWRQARILTCLVALDRMDVGESG